MVFVFAAMAPALKGQRVVAGEIRSRWVHLSLDQRRIVTCIDDPVLVTRIRTAIYTLYQLQVVAERMGLRASGLGPCTLLIDSAMLREVFEIQWKIESDENFPDAVVMDPDDQVMLITLRLDILYGDIMFEKFSEALPDFLGSKTRRSPKPRARWKHIFDRAPHSVTEFEKQLSELMEQVLWAWGVTPGFHVTSTSCPNPTTVDWAVSPAIVHLKEPISKSTKCISPQEHFAVEKLDKLYDDRRMEVPSLSTQEDTQLPGLDPLLRRRNWDRNNRAARLARRDDMDDILSHELPLAAGHASTSSSSRSFFACDGQRACAPTVVATLRSKQKRKAGRAISVSQVMSNELERRHFEASDVDWDRGDCKGEGTIDRVLLGISVVPAPDSSQVGVQLSAEPHLRPQGEKRADDGVHPPHQNDANLRILYLSSAEHSQVVIPKQESDNDINCQGYYREINSAVLQEHYWGSQEHWSRPLAMVFDTSALLPRLLGQICDWRAFHMSKLIRT